MGAAVVDSLVQETLQAADRDFTSFGGSTESQYLGWLLVLMQERIDQFCQQQGCAPEAATGVWQRRPQDVASVEDPPLCSDVREANTASAADGDHLAAAIESLPSVPRDVVRLRVLGGWTLVRIARHLGLDEMTVAGLLRQGLHRLRETIGGRRVG